MPCTAFHYVLCRFEWMHWRKCSMYAHLRQYSRQLPLLMSNWFPSDWWLQMSRSSLFVLHYLRDFLYWNSPKESIRRRLLEFLSVCTSRCGWVPRRFPFMQWFPAVQQPARWILLHSFSLSTWIPAVCKSDLHGWDPHLSISWHPWIHCPQCAISCDLFQILTNAETEPTNAISTRYVLTPLAAICAPVLGDSALMDLDVHAWVSLTLVFALHQLKKYLPCLSITSRVQLVNVHSWPLIALHARKILSAGACKLKCYSCGWFKSSAKLRNWCSCEVLCKLHEFVQLFVLILLTYISVFAYFQNYLMFMGMNTFVWVALKYCIKYGWASYQRFSLLYTICMHLWVEHAVYWRPQHTFDWM